MRGVARRAAPDRRSEHDRPRGTLAVRGTGSRSTDRSPDPASLDPAARRDQGPAAGFVLRVCAVWATGRCQGPRRAGVECVGKPAARPPDVRIGRGPPCGAPGVPHGRGFPVSIDRGRPRRRCAGRRRVWRASSPRPRPGRESASRATSPSRASRPPTSSNGAPRHSASARGSSPQPPRDRSVTALEPLTNPTFEVQDVAGVGVDTDLVAGALPSDHRSERLAKLRHVRLHGVSGCFRRVVAPPSTSTKRSTDTTRFGSARSIASTRRCLGPPSDVAAGAQSVCRRGRQPRPGSDRAPRSARRHGMPAHRCGTAAHSQRLAQALTRCGTYRNAIGERSEASRHPWPQPILALRRPPSGSPTAD